MWWMYLNAPYFPLSLLGELLIWRWTKPFSFVSYLYLYYVFDHVSNCYHEFSPYDKWLIVLFRAPRFCLRFSLLRQWPLWIFLLWDGRAMSKEQTMTQGLFKAPGSEAWDLPLPSLDMDRNLECFGQNDVTCDQCDGMGQIKPWAGWMMGIISANQGAMFLIVQSDHSSFSSI